MRFLLTVTFLLLVYGTCLSQKSNISDLLLQAENSIYVEPKEALQIATYISEKSENPIQSLEAAYLLTRGFYMQGNYDNALKIGLAFSKDDLENDSDTQFKLNILLAKILEELELNTLSTLYLSKVIQQSEKSANDDMRFWINGKILQYDPETNHEGNNEQTLVQLYKAKKEFNRIKNEHYPNQIGNINLELARIKLSLFQTDSVEYYLKTAYRESKLENPGNYLEMKCLQEYGHYLFLKKEHSAAIDSLNSAQVIAIKFTNIEEQIIISEAIAENYLALNDIENFNNYTDKSQLLNRSQTDIDYEAVNTAFNFINDNQTKKLSGAKHKFSQIFLSMGIGITLFILLWGILIFRYRKKTKQYQSFTDYFEKKQKSEPQPAQEQKSIKPSVIPKEMEEILLLKLEEFENSLDFNNKETSLSRLALKFETNTKYLSEIINTHKHKNFNTYINELRINAIIEKLKNDPVYLQYKISHLADISGFSSHSAFATVFKSVIGISPTTFINILRNKKEESSSNQVKK